MSVKPLREDEDALNQAKARLSHVYKELFKRFEERLVDSEFEDDFDDLETTKDVIRSILSLPAWAPIPARTEEIELFRHIVKVMYKLNAQWRSTTQVEYEPGLTRESNTPRGANLQERFEQPKEDPDMLRGVQLREVFLKMLTCCIPEKDTQALKAGIQFEFSKDASDDDEAPATRMAETLLPLMQQYIYRAVRRYYTQPPALPDAEYFAVANVRATHARVRKGLEAFLQATPVWQGLDVNAEDGSTDSLFTMLVLNATLNKTLLEQWGMEAKAREAIPYQLAILEQIKPHYAGGIENAIYAFAKNNAVEYPDMCFYLLGVTDAEKRSRFSEHVLHGIGLQVDAIMRSPHLPNYQGETEINRLLLSENDKGVKAEAWTWLMLMYIRLKGIRVKQEDPEFDYRTRALVTNSRKNPPVVDGELMTILRRLVSSLSFANHDFDFEAERQKSQFEFAQDVRFQQIATMERVLRRTSIYGWKELLDKLAFPSGPYDGPGGRQIRVEVPEPSGRF